MTLQSITPARFERLEDTVKQLVRRVNSIQKTLDLINDDRNLLEEIIEKLTSLKDSFHSTRDHIDKRTKDIKSDVAEFSHKVEDSVDKLSDSIEEKATVVDTLPPQIVNLKKRSLLQRLFNRGR